MLRKLTPPQIIILSFLAVILIGSILLSLPLSIRGGQHISYIDALFTSTSAVCVTGLVVKDTGNDFSFWGQLIILFLIQAGGLGIMTFSTIFFIILGRKISIKESLVLKESLGAEKFNLIKPLIRHIIVFTLLTELIGAFILFLSWNKSFALSEAVWQSVFHSISAFCNAGFSLFTTSLINFRGNLLTTGTVMALIVLGGLGFIVLSDIANKINFKKHLSFSITKLSLQSKIVIQATFILIISGAILFFILESNGILKEFSIKEKIITSLFHSISPRTAGFNVIDVAQQNNSSLLLTIILMFIGGSPSSTAGGIKTVTFAILLILIIGVLKGKNKVQVFKRNIPDEIVTKSLAIFFLATFWVIIITTILLKTQIQILPLYKLGTMARLTFETISAFGTVGLSTGITGQLNIIGKILIIITMFVGRLGPLTVFLMFNIKEDTTKVEYPDESVLVG